MFKAVIFGQSIKVFVQSHFTVESGLNVTAQLGLKKIQLPKIKINIFVFSVFLLLSHDANQPISTTVLLIFQKATVFKDLMQSKILSDCMSILIN